MVGDQPNRNRGPDSPNGDGRERTPSSTGANQPSPSSGSQPTDFQVSAPSISLPKGGGAIQGIGEKFEVNAVSGTGSFSVPIAVSPGRGGFGPQLTLAYNSGGGNGPFGLGWDLSVPNITRKTDKGWPQYRDAEESDVFILSGAEDLVPMLVETGNQWNNRTPDLRTENGEQFLVEYYRPRIEGLFARIERWTSQTNGNIHWRSFSQDNIRSVYGRTEDSRIAEPVDPAIPSDPTDPPPRIFSWLLEETSDDKGNIVQYVYTRENLTNVVSSKPEEKNRLASPAPQANQYLKRILYGNATPYQPGGWLFEVVFDYGDHPEENPTPQENPNWPVRQDPFSTYRATFEIRTYRLCRRVLMFHRFPELGSEPELVRSTDFQYEENPVLTRMTSITHAGYVRQNNAGPYTRRALPPLECTYTKVEIDQHLHDLDPDTLENLPYGVDGTTYQFVDLEGEGLSGILTEQGGAWWYKPNLGNTNNSMVGVAEGLPPPVQTPNGAPHFGPHRVVATQPATAQLGQQGWQLVDLAGDGRLNVVQFSQPVPGFYERTDEETWETFKAFPQVPNIQWDDPNLKILDLNGDGHADVLITEHEVLTWYPSKAKEGFGAAQTVRKPFDEEQGPAIVFVDGTQTIFLADMAGDGLSDIARIRNGEVCYWPNLGYGRFGKKITMDNSPWFDHPDHFDPGRMRLVDIDGSGTTDIIYIGPFTVTIWANQSGNSWDDLQRLDQFPHIDNVTTVTTADLFGNGTACLVCSSPLPGDTHHPMRYIDLMGGIKPHLLQTIRNNLGAETTLQYAPSTRYYLADKANGRPWVTKLPFPVYVVDRVETYDHISRNRFVTRYAYHHGYFDGHEREFRGFGMVEQWDTETYATLSQTDTLPIGDNIDQASHIPPVRTRTWFHTGAYIQGQKISRQFESEYYHYRPLDLTEEEFEVEFKATLLPDSRLDPTWTSEEAREAARALKGSMLRQEIYAQDNSSKSEHPYSVSESNYTLVRNQPFQNNRHAVFFTHPHETIAYQYERARYPSIPNVPESPLRTDPRISHQLVLAVDQFGNVLRSAAIGYGRQLLDPDLSLADQNQQTQPLMTCTENSVTNDIDQPQTYRTPLPCESQTYELMDLSVPSGQRMDWGTVDNMITIATPVPYEGEDIPSNGQKKRLLEHTRILYRNNDLTGPLPLKEIQSLALPYESYQLAFTQALLTHVYGARVTTAMLEKEGRYVHSEGDTNWWISSGQIFYSAGSTDTPAVELPEAQDNFFLPRRFQNPFGYDTQVTYDTHKLLVAQTTDALKNTVTATNNYRVLQPSLITDPNGNHAQAAFDALGMVVGTAVMNNDSSQGDAIDALLFQTDLEQSQIDTFFADPQGPTAATLLGNASSRIIYDINRYHSLGNVEQPVFSATLARETHASEPIPQGRLQIQVNFTYSDGFGREIQQKIQAEPGPLDLNDPNSPTIDPRWVGSGWTIFNNKGKPVKQYEPFFSPTHQFEFAKIVGVSSTLFYDPVERVIATLHPNHTYEKVVFDPWRQKTWDVNDTLLQTDPKNDPDVGEYFSRLLDTDYLPTWYDRRINGQLGTTEQDTAQKTALHAGTPSRTYLDTLGRSFLAKADNNDDHFYRTHTQLDLEGNPLTITDDRGNVVMEYQVSVPLQAGGTRLVPGYDVAGRQLYQRSMDAGERWMLNDVAGKPIYGWDSRTHRIQTTYDELQRPTHSYLHAGGGDPELITRTVYGESHPQKVALNLRGQAYLQLDGAGLMISTGIIPQTTIEEAFDFKGNLLKSRRQLARVYKQRIDWTPVENLLNEDPLDPVAIATGLVPYLEQNEEFQTSTTYDALNRPTSLTTPDNSEARPTYNQANLLEKVEVNLRGTRQNNVLVWTPFVNNIDYDAKGQRIQIEYGSGAGPGQQGVTTNYEYDAATFRLTHIITHRPTTTYPDDCPTPPNPPCGIQNLFYTYDPVGNITTIRDDAQQTIFFNNAQIAPSMQYEYDPLYRLTKAQGREHIGQTDNNLPQHRADLKPHYDFNDITRRQLAHRNEWTAMRNYTELYEYDGVGNILRMKHQANLGSWTRHYDYDTTSNRLRSTNLPGDPTPEDLPTLLTRYTYDPHGNMTLMPHLYVMQWDFQDQLKATTTQIRNDGGIPEMTYYVYDAAGERVRKVTENTAAPGVIPTRKDERLYLGGFEIYREYNGTGNLLTLERETLHIMDDQQRIALVETRTQGADGSPQQLLRYQFGNHLGSASLELNETGAIISYEEYHPYGTTAFQSGPNVAEVSLKRYRYTGKERDEETGLYYHGARYYACWLGRWVSADPIGIGDGINIYSYLRGRPIILVDANGNSGKSLTEEFGVALNKVFGESAERLVAEARVKLGYSVKTQINVKGAPRVGAEFSHDIAASLNGSNTTKFLEEVKSVQLEKYKDPGGPERLLNKFTEHGRQIVKRTKARTAQLPSATKGNISKVLSERLTYVLPADTTRMVAENFERFAKQTLKGIREIEKVEVFKGNLKSFSNTVKGSKSGSAAAKLGETVAQAAKQGATVAKTAKNVAKNLASKGGGVASKALGPISLAIDLHSFATAKTGPEKVQATADLGATAIGFLGPVGAAFSSGYGAGQLLDEAHQFGTKKLFGKDYSPSAAISSTLTAVDETVSPLWADTSKPAYTQTLGWKINEWLEG